MLYTSPSSQKPPKAPRPDVILAKIQRQVGGLLRRSARGVPLLVLADDTRAVSMSYFPRTRGLCFDVCLWFSMATSAQVTKGASAGTRVTQKGARTEIE